MTKLFKCYLSKDDKFSIRFVTLTKLFYYKEGRNKNNALKGFVRNVYKNTLT